MNKQLFFIGDKVQYIGNSKTWRKNKKMIIVSAEYSEGQFQYSTTSGAWFDNSDFVLVEKANSKTFKLLDKFNAENE